MKKIIGPLTNINGVRTWIEREIQGALDSGNVVEIDVRPLKHSRSYEQNRLQWLWYKEASLQGDMTPQEYRAYCKAHFGVPILRAEDEEFRAVYDKVIRPLDYADKLELMREPIDFPVTSRMTVAQMTEYLNQVHGHFRGLGFELTEPAERAA